MFYGYMKLSYFVCGKNPMEQLLNTASLSFTTSILKLYSGVTPHDYHLLILHRRRYGGDMGDGSPT